MLKTVIFSSVSFRCRTSRRSFSAAETSGEYDDVSCRLGQILRRVQGQQVEHVVRKRSAAQPYLKRNLSAAGRSPGQQYTAVALLLVPRVRGR